MLFASIPFLYRQRRESPDLCPSTSLPQSMIVSIFSLDITDLTRESMPLFSDNNLPAIATSLIIDDFEISLSRFILDRVQIAMFDFESPKNNSSSIGRIILHNSPAISSIRFMQSVCVVSWRCSANHFL